MKAIPVKLTNVMASVPAYVDDEDFEDVLKHSWSFCRGYPQTVIRGRHEFLHRFILKLHKGDPQVDHKNRDKMDNRKENLRICSPSENQWNRGKLKTNTSGFKGVYKYKNKWRAKISTRGIVQFLGEFKDIKDAVLAYTEAEKKFHGCNVP